MPPPKIKKDDRPLIKALPVDVLVDLDPRGKIFCYAYGLITLESMNKHWERLSHAVVLVFDIFGHLNYEK